jgi:hypothetical protein
LPLFLGSFALVSAANTGAGGLNRHRDRRELALIPAAPWGFGFF